MLKKLHEKYDKLIEYYSSEKKAYENLKNHYCDVCSDGDVHINFIIDNINTRSDLDFMILQNPHDESKYICQDIMTNKIEINDNLSNFMMNKIDQKSFDYFCDHICDTIDYLLEGNKSNPFWYN